jgi:hypothetical protein
MAFWKAVAIEPAFAALAEGPLLLLGKAAFLLVVQPDRCKLFWLNARLLEAQKLDP